MLSFESDLDFPMEAVGLTGLGGPMGAGIGDPLAMDAELGLLLDAPGGRARHGRGAAVSPLTEDERIATP
jgi:hypothetical protein